MRWTLIISTSPRSGYSPPRQYGEASRLETSYRWDDFGMGMTYGRDLQQKRQIQIQVQDGHVEGMGATTFMLEYYTRES